MKRRARLVAITVLILALAGGAFWWRARITDLPKIGPQNGKSSGESRPVPVLTATVLVKDVPLYLDALGTVQASNSVIVRSRVDGELIEVLFKEGQDVHAGDVLARIDSRTYQAQYEQAQATRDKDVAQLQAARHDLERYVGLGNRVTGQSVDTQRASVRQLEAAVRADQAAIDLTKIMLDYATIVAPIDGLAGLRLVDKGNIIRAADQTGLLLLTQVQPIAVVFSLPQQDLPAIVREMTAHDPLVVVVTQPVKVAGGGNTILDTGQLKLIDNQIDQATGTIRLKAIMPNAERLLWPGGFVNVRLLLTTRRGGLVVPIAAVQRGPKGAYVFLVRPDHTVDMRPVKTSTVENGETLVETGLLAGDIVVIEGMGKLKEGARVTLAEERKSTNSAPPNTPP